MKKIILALVSCVLLATGAGAADAQKIATIDLKKVFENFWRTKQANTKLQEEANELERDRKIMMDQLQKADVEYKKLVDSASEPSISATERDKRKKDAEEQLIGLRELDTKIKTFDNGSRAKIGEEQRRIRDNILSEIRDTIKAYVRNTGHTLVIDGAAESGNGTPVFLFNAGSDDLTDVILKQLNVGAPATPEKEAPKPNK